MFRPRTRRPTPPPRRPAPEHSTDCEPGHRSPEGFVDAPGPGRSPAETTWRWCRASRRMDLATVQSFLAPDATLHTPVTDTFRFEGYTEVARLLANVFAEGDYLDYHTDAGDDETRVVAYHGRMNGIEYEEYLVFTFDEQHRVRDIVTSVRGTYGHAVFMARLGPRFLAEARQPRWKIRAIGGALSVFVRAIVAMDRWIVPMAAPLRDHTAPGPHARV